MSQSRNLGNVGDGIVRFADGTTQSTAASGFPSVNPTYISANTTAVINTYYVATSNLTLTLPSSPASGSTIGFSNQSNTRICVINNNGSEPGDIPTFGVNGGYVWGTGMYWGNIDAFSNYGGLLNTTTAWASSSGGNTGDRLLIYVR